MAAVVNDVYKEYIAGYAVGKGTLPSLTCRLFTNNVTFGDSTTSGLTEASGSGYAAVALPASGWTLTNTSGVGIATSATATFTLTGAFTFYGYYLTDGNNSGAYVMGETFSTAVTISSSGATFTVNIVLDCED